MTVYKYTDSRPRSWDEIEKHFTDHFSGRHHKMLDLIKHIKKTGASQRLYALTSMDKLVVSVYGKIDLTKEALHITYNLHTDKWHFEYYAKPFHDAELVRTYDSEIGIQKFDDFLKKVNW